MYNFNMPKKSKNLSFHVRYSDYKIKHTHNDFWEFMLVVSGSILHKINGGTQKIEKNTLCIVRPADVHSIHNEKGGSSSHINMCVTADYLKTFLEYISPGLYDKLLVSPPIAIRLTPIRANEMTQYANAILISGKETYEQSMHLLFLMLLQEALSSQIKTSNIKSEYSEPVSRLILSMNDAKNLALNMEELIKRTNYSYSHMNKLFRKEVGITLSQYLKTKKLEYAKTLLSDTTMPLTDIALALGFTGYPHFSVFFKNITGQSPAQYAKSHKNNYVITKTTGTKKREPSD